VLFSAVPVTETLHHPELFGGDRRNAPQEHGPAFCPGGVGVIANLDLISAQWFPILIGLIGSTILSLLVTAYVMRWCSPRNLDPGSANTLPTGNLVA
jgi:hypothetical protein